jgi:phage terminase large subunit
VYGLGEIGSLQGAVFNNWTQVKEIPKEAEYLGTGLDFGFTNDPTAAVDVYRYNGELYIDEVVYEPGLLNSVIYDRLKGKTRDIVADSADPKSIAELRQLGLRITGADKGKDSVIHGIQLLQNYRMNVTERSLNVIKELRGYLWKKDKTGKAENVPIDNMNHAMDSLRYITSEKLTKKQGRITF